MPNPNFDDPPTPINGYPLQFFSGEHNPEAGGGEYFIGASPMGIDLFGQYATSVYPLYAGHVRRFVFQIRVNGTLGSAEPGRLYLSQGEIYLELTGAGHEICSGAHSVNGEVYWDQLLCVVHGDLERGMFEIPEEFLRQRYLQFYISAPDLATLPTNVSYFGQLWIEP